MSAFDTSKECAEKLDAILIQMSIFNELHRGSLEYNANKRFYCIERLLDGLKTGESKIEIFAFSESSQVGMFEEIARCICFNSLNNFNKQKNPEHPSRDFWILTWDFHGYQLKITTRSFAEPAILEINGLPVLKEIKLDVFPQNVRENLIPLKENYQLGIYSELFFEIMSRKLSKFNKGILSQPLEFCLFLDYIYHKTNNMYRQPVKVPGFNIPDASRFPEYSHVFTDQKHAHVSDFFYAFAQIICKQKNLITEFLQTIQEQKAVGSLGDKKYRIQISWRYGKYLFRAFKKRIGHGSSMWYLSIEDDGLLDSMFSLTQSLHARLNRVEALIASPPQLG